MELSGLRDQVLHLPLCHGQIYPPPPPHKKKGRLLGVDTRDPEKKTVHMCLMINSLPTGAEHIGLNCKVTGCMNDPDDESFINGRHTIIS